MMRMRRNDTLLCDHFHGGFDLAPALPDPNHYMSTCLHVYLGDGEKLEPLHVRGGQVGQQLGAQAQHPIQLSHHHYHHYHHHLSSFSWVQRRQPRMSWAETRSGMAEWAAQIALHNKSIMLTRYLFSHFRTFLPILLVSNYQTEVKEKRH